MIDIDRLHQVALCDDPPQQSGKTTLHGFEVAGVIDVSSPQTVFAVVEFWIDGRSAMDSIEVALTHHGIKHRRFANRKISCVGHPEAVTTVRIVTQRELERVTQGAVDYAIVEFKR